MSYRFFQNRKCEYFPCHKTDNPQDFNCIFCYCPLYALKEECKGHFTYTKSGIKDCSECLIPHSEANYDYITQKCALVIEFVKKREEEIKG